MKHEDEKTSLISKLLSKGKSLSFIMERFTEEFEENLELIHIYNVLRVIAREHYLEHKRTELTEHKFFPELRFVFKHEPTSDIVDEKSSQNWKVLLNRERKFLIYYRDHFVGETDFGMKTVDFELHGDFLILLNLHNLCSIYLPSFKALTPLNFDSDKPLSLDLDFLYFDDFRQKYTLDEFGGILLGVVQRGKFERAKILPWKLPISITKKNKIEKIEIVHLLSNGDLKKCVIIQRKSDKFETIDFTLNRFISGPRTRRVRFKRTGNKIDEITLSNASDLPIDSTQEFISNLDKLDMFSEFLKSNPEAVISKDGEYLFFNDSNSTKVLELKCASAEPIWLIGRRFLSVHEIDSIFYILTTTADNRGFAIYEWDGNKSTTPLQIYELPSIHSDVVTADLHVYLKENPDLSELKEFKSSETTTHINQKYTEVEYLRLIRDLLLIASRDKLLKAWTLEGEYLGVVAEVKDFSELRDFVKLSKKASGYVIDDTVVFIGNDWLSGSRGYSDHVHVCLGGIPEFHFKEQVLKVYSTNLSDAYFKLAGDKSDVSKGRKG